MVTTAAATNRDLFGLAAFVETEEKLAGKKARALSETFVLPGAVSAIAVMPLLVPPEIWLEKAIWEDMQMAVKVMRAVKLVGGRNK